jgi:hypothetical protein
MLGTWELGKKKGFPFFPQIFFSMCEEERMVERTIEGWLTVLEKKGLRQAGDILENYGIESETDLSVLDQDDFNKLTSRGLKPLHVKKLQHCCDAVRERAENMLPSSLNTPAAAALLSSEALNVVTPAAHSVAAVESVSENEIERDGEEDDDDSDDDLQIVGEQSCTADSTGASSGGTKAPVKKGKITLTEEEERFACMKLTIGLSLTNETCSSRVSSLR